MKKKIISLFAAAMICTVFTGCGSRTGLPVPNAVTSDDMNSHSLPDSSVVSTSDAGSSESGTQSSTVGASSSEFGTQSETSSVSTVSSSEQSSTEVGAGDGEESTTSTSYTEETPSSVSTSEDKPAPPVVSSDFDAEFFKDDLFIGDSIFTGLYLYSYIDREKVAASVGYTAYGAQVKPFDEEYYSGSAVDYAKSRKPKHIIIMLGSNSLSPLAAQDNYNDFINGYRGLLNSLKKDCAKSTICVVSVTPITANSSMASYSGVTNTIIDNANAILKFLCSELDVIYYDLNSVLKDENGYFSERYAEVDGMHFLGTTYPVLLSGVQKILE